MRSFSCCLSTGMHISANSACLGRHKCDVKIVTSCVSVSKPTKQSLSQEPRVGHCQRSLLTKMVSTQDRMHASGGTHHHTYLHFRCRYSTAPVRVEHIEYLSGVSSARPFSAFGSLPLFPKGGGIPAFNSASGTNWYVEQDSRLNKKCRRQLELLLCALLFGTRERLRRRHRSTWDGFLWGTRFATAPRLLVHFTSYWEDYKQKQTNLHTYMGS